MDVAQWLVRDSAEKAFRNRAVIKLAVRVSLIRSVASACDAVGWERQAQERVGGADVMQ